MTDTAMTTDALRAAMELSRAILLLAAEGRAEEIDALERLRLTHLRRASISAITPSEEQRKLLVQMAEINDRTIEELERRQRQIMQELDGVARGTRAAHAYLANAAA
jgi:hypothetical protein